MLVDGIRVSPIGKSMSLLHLAFLLPVDDRLQSGALRGVVRVVNSSGVQELARGMASGGRSSEAGLVDSWIFGLLWAGSDGADGLGESDAGAASGRGHLRPRKPILSLCSSSSWKATRS